MHALPAPLHFVCAAEAGRIPAARVRPSLERAVRRMENVFDAPFGPHANPLRHLGALGFLLLGVAVVSGIYVYIWFDTSAHGAYSSVAALGERQWGLGALMRSLHRYASDAFILVTLLHLAREWAYGRTHGFRWFSWVSGVPLLWLAFGAGVVGFWLAWDELAQFSLTATLEWFDALQLFGEPLARNVLTPARLDDRFFSLVVFLHIGLPLLLLLALWMHIQRIARPDVWPSRALTLGTLAALTTLSLVDPVTSLDRADLTRTAQSLAFDWFYLAPNALSYDGSPLLLWALAGAITLLLVALPLLPHPPAAPMARVDPDHCNGCRRCLADCPYAAITLQPHPNGKAGAEVAVVDAALCASCGICAGACPSTTPLRREAHPVSGIDMPQLNLDTLRARLDEALGAPGAPHKLVVFGCAEAARLDGLAGADTVVLPLLCAGQLAPSFIQYALRRGAGGVLIAACREDGCEFRLGERWTRERLAGAREPHLRRSVASSAWRLVYAGPGETQRVRRELSALRAAIEKEDEHA